VKRQIKNLPYTHFLCLPLNYDEIMTNVTKFQGEIIQESEKNPIEGFDASIILPPQQLHLTILMLKLYTKKQIEKVKQILEELKPQIYDTVDTRSLVVNLKGLEIMNDDPSQVDVLYVQILETDRGGRLAKMTKFIVDKFKSYGLANEEQDRNVKLHATVLNSRFRKQEGDAKDDKKPKRETFDARGIMTKYANHDFGKAHLSELHLSQRSFYDNNGFYHCVKKVNLPS